MNLVLIGYRGTGKTSVGPLLAERLGWKFIDADPYLEAKAGRSIKEIFATQGEPVFRDLEASVIAELAAGDSQVLALGGGAVMREETRRVVSECGKSVWLQASPETIYARIAGDPTTAERRPNLTAQGGLHEISELLTRRAPIYRECADFIVDTEGKDVDQIADEILGALNGKGWGLGAGD